MKFSAFWAFFDGENWKFKKWNFYLKKWWKKISQKHITYTSLSLGDERLELYQIRNEKPKTVKTTQSMYLNEKSTEKNCI